MGSVEWYMLTMSVNIADQGGVDLQGLMGKLKQLLFSYSEATTCLHKYKVTGEARVIAVFEVTNIIGLERMVAGLARLGNIDVTCKPLIRYQKFAEMLDVEESLRVVAENSLKDDAQLYWLEFTVEYPGKSMDELLTTWKNEAVAALSARKKLHLELFKNVAERKVQVLVAMNAADLDTLSFNLPLMKENGNGVTIKCHALQNLEWYCNHISKEETIKT